MLSFFSKISHKTIERETLFSYITHLTQIQHISMIQKTSSTNRDSYGNGKKARGLTAGFFHVLYV